MKPHTPYTSMFLCFTLALLSVNPGYAAAAKQKEVGVMTPMKYEGGSLPLNQHDKLETFVSKDEVVLVQGKQRFVIPVKNITEVSYGNDVHRRVGAAIGVAALTLGIGLMLLLVKTKKHFVGIVWADKPTTTETAVAESDHWPEPCGWVHSHVSRTGATIRVQCSKTYIPYPMNWKPTPPDCRQTPIWKRSKNTC